jgi:hypothetical protein
MDWIAVVSTYLENRLFSSLNNVGSRSTYLENRLFSELNNVGSNPAPKELV